MAEVWKQIPFYPDYYASTSGRIKSFKNERELVLKPSINTNGYYYINLSQGGKVKNKRVHTLIATTFIENEEQKEMVDHIDRNKLNNSVVNLRWATRSENSLNTAAVIDAKNIRMTRFGTYYIQFTRKTVRYYVGTFASLEEAVFARDTALLDV